MSFERRAVRQGTLLTVQGSFDGAAADELLRVLRDLDPEETVTVDFRQVRVMHDTAVARLASCVSHAVHLLGLSEHHWRLLRYFGLQQPANAGGDGDQIGAA